MKKIYQETLKNILKRYQIYDKFISLKELEKAIQKNFHYSEEIENVSSDVAITLEMDNFVFHYLCQQAKENIDLEMFMIEKLASSSFCNIICRKVLNPSFNSANIREDILMKAIESYDGKISFSLHLTRVIKKEVNKIPNPLPKQSQNQIEIKKPQPEKQNLTQEEKPKTIIDKIEEYRKQHTISKDPGYFEYIFHAFAMADFMKIEDPIFKQYLLLKNGYYEKLYFSDKDIQIILNQSEEQIKKYQILNLEILKEGVSQLFDQASIFIQKSLSLTSGSVNK